MFLLRYIASKIENFCDDLFSNYSCGTCLITFIVFSVGGVLFSIYFLVYDLQYSLKPALLIVAAIYAAICIIFIILTIIMKNVDSHIDYYTRAVALGFLTTALILAMLVICPLP